MRLVLMILLFLPSAYAKFSQAFMVDINDRGIKITSPLKKTDVVSIIVKNNTLDKIVSELKSNDKVIKRFVLKAEGKEVFQVKLKGVTKLEYVPIAPPFESADLRFEQKPYEIPEKKK
jgi:hypothetical protein